MRLLLHAALGSLETRRWLAAQNIDILATHPGAGLLRQCLAANFDPGDAAATQAFLAAQSAQDQSVLAALLMGRPATDPAAIARDTLRTLHRQQLEARRTALTARLRQSGLPPGEVAALQAEVVDIMAQMSQVGRSL